MAGNGGRRPGGGRKRGAPHKATIERALGHERVLREAEMRGERLAKEVLNDFMKTFASIADYHQPHPETIAAWSKGDAALAAKEPMFEKYAGLAMQAARDLAKYQSPTFKAIEVSAPSPAMQGSEGKKVTRFTLAIFDEDLRTRAI